MSDKTQQRNPGQTSGSSQYGSGTHGSMSVTGSGQDMSNTGLLAIFDPKNRAFNNLPGQQIPGASWSQAATFSGEEVVIAGFASKAAYAPLEQDPSLSGAVKGTIEMLSQGGSQQRSSSNQSTNPTGQD